MRRELGQLSLADGLVAQVGRNGTLERIGELVDWTAFAGLLGGIYAAPVGRPSYGPLPLLKCLLLQQWYRLSDPGLEEALADRLSFRRFVGLALADPVPDHSTLSRFRAELVKHGLAERLLAELNRQLDARGLMLKEGTLVDATLVAADAKRPGKGAPVAGGSDPDARWVVQRNKATFGYKAHLAVDQGRSRGRLGLVRQALLTGANVSEHTTAPDLVQGDEGVFYGDAGYDSRALRRQLRRTGVGDGIVHAARHHLPLTDAQRQRNRRLQPLRAEVERTFAVMKRLYGYARVRYRSLARNRLQLNLLCLAINLRRALALAA